MGTLREKITFVLTALAYLLFHLRLGANAKEIISATLYQIMMTAPFSFGLTYIIGVFVREFLGRWPPWDRLVRIFFTIGIIFGLYFGIYEHATGGKVPVSLGY